MKEMFINLYHTIRGDKMSEDYRVMTCERCGAPDQECTYHAFPDQWMCHECVRIMYGLLVERKCEHCGKENLCTYHRLLERWLCDNCFKWVSK